MKKDELSCGAFVLLFALIALAPFLLLGVAMWCDKVDKDRIADVASKYDALTKQTTASSLQKENIQKEDNVNSTASSLQKENIQKEDNVNYHSSDDDDSDEDEITKVTFSDWLKTPIGSTAKENAKCLMINFPKLPQSVKDGLSEHILKQKFMHNDTRARIYMRIDDNFERHHNAFTEVYVQDEMIRFVATTFYGNAISTCELIFH